jgi:hypothetical protein
VFCPAQADTFGAKRHSNSRLIGLIGICPDTERTGFISPFHEEGKILIDQ